MREFKKLTDDEIKKLVQSNLQARKLLESLKEYVSPDVYQKVLCPDQKIKSNTEQENGS